MIGTAQNPVQTSFWQRVNRSRQIVIFTCHYLFIGMFCAIWAGEALVAERWPSSPWGTRLNYAVVLACACLLLQGIPQPSLSNRDDGLTFAGMFIFAMLAFFRSYDLALVAMGVIGAALLWMLARRRGRNHFLSAAGWLLGGLVAVRTRWPASQRLYLLMVIGGLATAVQGAWEIPYMSRMFQSRRQSSAT